MILIPILGGIKPWNAIQKTFNNEEVDTLYFLSDGQPNKDRQGGDWTRKDYDSTAKYYADQNNNRDIQLKVNTTSLGEASPWMEKLSDLTNGDYNQIDQDSLTDTSETS